ncbi:hypothetical protein GMORB2_4370 [Geosmithia morbida]|uniref:Uncharacterized protein n=1 Tax=Geosmithia morbida TaxID=1094350 RepID=A0A9P4Z0P0_9HYPO|nr:uncharacterized protein GMORB2_4370 [Geosmithia morbida]KAF4125530.1 hypothetical protein GMORB2_4370 [Geosmithia morbida]
MRPPDWRTSWSHLPLDKGEWISELWHCKDLDTMESGLTLVTNKHRVQAIGYYSKPLKSSIRLVAVLGPQPRRLYYDADYGIETHGIDPADWPWQPPLGAGLSPRKRLRPPRSPTPRSPAPRFPMTSFCFTRACLEGVSGVAVCQIGAVVSGLILSYAKGHRECVGNIRTDCLRRPVPVGPATEFWLVVSTVKPGKLQATAVDFDHYPPGDTRIPWEGVLEWWQAGTQARIYHEGREIRPFDD